MVWRGYGPGTALTDQADGRGVKDPVVRKGHPITPGAFNQPVAGHAPGNEVHPVVCNQSVAGPAFRNEPQGFD